MVFGSAHIHTYVYTSMHAHHSTAQHTTAQHSTAQHTTAQHSTAHYSTAQHTTAQHSTAHHSTPQHSTAHHTTAQHTTAQHTCHHTTAHHSTVCALATLAGQDCTAVWFDVTWRPRCTKLYELNSACGTYKPVLCIDCLVALISLKL